MTAFAPTRALSPSFIPLAPRHAQRPGGFFSRIDRAMSSFHNGVAAVGAQIARDVRSLTNRPVPVPTPRAHRTSIASQIARDIRSILPRRQEAKPVLDVRAVFEASHSRGMAIAATTTLALLAAGITLNSSASGSSSSPVLSDLQQRSRLGARMVQDHAASLRPTSVIIPSPPSIAPVVPAATSVRLEGTIVSCADNPGTCTVSGMARTLGNRLARQEHIRIFPRRIDFFRALQTGSHNGTPTDLWGLNRIEIGSRVALVQDGESSFHVDVQSSEPAPFHPRRISHQQLAPHHIQRSPAAPLPAKPLVRVPMPILTEPALPEPYPAQTPTPTPHAMEEMPPPPEPVFALPLSARAPVTTPTPTSPF